MTWVGFRKKLIRGVNELAICLVPFGSDIDATFLLKRHASSNSKILSFHVSTCLTKYDLNYYHVYKTKPLRTSYDSTFNLLRLGSKAARTTTTIT